VVDQESAAAQLSVAGDSTDSILAIELNSSHTQPAMSYSINAFEAVEEMIEVGEEELNLCNCCHQQTCASLLCTSCAQLFGAQDPSPKWND
jgi:hypothetical protein